MCRRHEQVEAEDVENARRLVDYFAGMARRAYTGLYGLRPTDELATDLHHFLIDHGGVWKELQPSSLSSWAAMLSRRDPKIYLRRFAPSLLVVPF
jgi:hypothetical protein